MENLLDAFLSTQPKATAVQQKARFSSVRYNFEFGLFVLKSDAERIAQTAMNKGFTVWGNVDSRSAFLYGAGLVDKDGFSDIMAWLKGAATANQKINIGIHNPGESMKVIVVEV